MPINVYAEETVSGDLEETVFETVDNNVLYSGEEEAEKYGITPENCIIVDADGNALESTEAEKGSTVYLQFAPADEERDVFTKWNVTTESNAEVTVTDDSFVMPAEAVKAVAEYEKYLLVTVTDGTADPKKAKEGDTVSIAVRELNVDESFGGWIANTEGVTIADTSAANTSFIMPAGDAEITAKINIDTEYTGFKTVDGKTYYLNKGEKVIGPHYIAEKKETYYLDGNGVLKTGLQSYWSKLYYANEEGILQTGWQLIDNNWYYFGKDFIAKKGIQKINEKYYYFDNNCVMQTGVQKPYGNSTQYLYGNGGALQNTEGWHKVKDLWYYTNKNGVVKTGWQKIKDRWYYFNSKGEMQTGFQTINKKKYYFGGSNDGKMKYGWYWIDNQWYYFGATNNDGVMKTGWQKINNKWYYMNNKGIMQTGWQKINNKWYYLNKSGSMRTGWLQDNNKWYFLYDSGAMATGWLKRGSNTWYYMKDSGAMTVGWLKLDDIWYYFTESGKMATGKISINGKTNEFNSKGRWIDTAWLAKQSYPYYLEVNRALNVMTIYCKDYNGEYTIPYRAVTVSTGFPDTPTYLGHSVIDGKNRWYYFEEDEAYIAYACFFSQGRRMMHSIAYWEPRHDALVEGEFNKLGDIASHGCVRMTIDNAKWIYYNCPNGTPVYVYEDWDNPGPLGKPYVRRITAWGTGWDPYDDEPGNPYNN